MVLDYSAIASHDVDINPNETGIVSHCERISRIYPKETIFCHPCHWWRTFSFSPFNLPAVARTAVAGSPKRSFDGRMLHKDWRPPDPTKPATSSISVPCKDNSAGAYSHCRQALAAATASAQGLGCSFPCFRSQTVNPDLPLSFDGMPLETVQWPSVTNRTERIAPGDTASI